jgi:hypothetical protein
MRIEDESLLGAVARLSISQDFKLFMEKLIKKEYDEAVEKCIIEDKPGRFQGKAEFLKELIKTVDESREVHRQRSTPGINMGQSL